MAVGADEHGHVPGPDLLVAGRGAVVAAALHWRARDDEQGDDVVGQVLGDAAPGQWAAWARPCLGVMVTSPSSRWTTRSRSGAATGAPIRRGAWLAAAARTGR